MNIKKTIYSYLFANVLSLSAIAGDLKKEEVECMSEGKRINVQDLSQRINSFDSKKDVEVFFQASNKIEPQGLLILSVEGYESRIYNPQDISAYVLSSANGVQLQCYARRE